MEAQADGLGCALLVRARLVRVRLDEAGDLGQPPLRRRLLVQPELERVLIEHLLVHEVVQERRRLLRRGGAAVLDQEGLPHDLEALRGDHDPRPLPGRRSLPEQHTPEEQRPDDHHVERGGAPQAHG